MEELDHGGERQYIVQNSEWINIKCEKVSKFLMKCISVKELKNYLTLCWAYFVCTFMKMNGMFWWFYRTAIQSTGSNGMFRCSGTEIPSRFTYVFLNSEDLNMVKIFVFVFAFFFTYPISLPCSPQCFLQKKDNTHWVVLIILLLQVRKASREANRDFG